MVTVFQGKLPAGFDIACVIILIGIVTICYRDGYRTLVGGVQSIMMTYHHILCNPDTHLLHILFGMFQHDLVGQFGQVFLAPT